jgi:hypothetical protein
MGLMFLESFDYCTDAELLSGNWTTTFGPSAIVSGGRTRNGFSGGILKTFDLEQGQLTTGFAFLASSTLGSTIEYRNIISSFTVGCGPVGDGRLQVYANLASHTNFSAPSTFVVQNGNWYYIEFNCSVSRIELPPNPPTHPNDTFFVRCNYDVRINESSILSGTLDSPERGTPDHNWENHLHIATLFLETSGGGVIDDLYVTDGPFLGDTAVITLMPTGDGTYQNFTPLDPGPHYQMVDEKPPDEELSYNSADTAGQIDTYTFEDLVPFTGDIKGTQAMFRVVKSDAGSGAVRGVYGAALAFTGKFYPSELSYRYLCDPQGINPITETSWTQSDINNIELGVERVNP